jgi:tetratricopeptide (TPR) repeat protein
MYINITLPDIQHLTPDNQDIAITALIEYSKNLYLSVQDAQNKKTGVLFQSADPFRRQVVYCFYAMQKNISNRRAANLDAILTSLRKFQRNKPLGVAWVRFLTRAERALNKQVAAGAPSPVPQAGQGALAAAPAGEVAVDPAAPAGEVAVDPAPDDDITGVVGECIRTRSLEPLKGLPQELSVQVLRAIAFHPDCTEELSVQVLRAIAFHPDCTSDLLNSVLSRPLFEDNKPSAVVEILQSLCAEILGSLSGELANQELAQLTRCGEMIVSLCNDHGLALFNREQYQASLEILRSALELNLKLNSCLHITVYNQYALMGAAALHLDWYGEEAKDYLDEALKIATETSLRPDGSSQVDPTLLENLGIVNFKLDQVEQAKQFFERALQAVIRDPAGPGSHRLKQSIKFNLGIALMKLENYVGARTELMGALAIEEGYNGRRPEQMIKTLSSLGDVLLKLGEQDVAISVLSRVVCIADHAFGAGHRSNLVPLFNLGMALLQANVEAELALLSFREALPIARKAGLTAIIGRIEGSISQLQSRS